MPNSSPHFPPDLDEWEQHFCAFSLLSSLTSVGFFQADRLRHYTHVSEGWCKITQLAPEQALGEGWRQWVHPSDQYRLAIALQQVNPEHDASPKHDYLFEIEYRLQNSQGAVIWIHEQTILHQDKDGTLVGYMGIIMDISVHKRAAQESHFTGLHFTECKQVEQTVLQLANREKLLRETTERIRRSLDLQTIFNTACQEIRAVIQADRVGIFKVEATTNCYQEQSYPGKFVAEAVVRGFNSVVGIPVAAPCFGANYAHLYDQGHYFVADDIADSGLSIRYLNVMVRLKVRACIIMPLICGEELWGLLCVHQCGKTRQWKQAEITFIHQVADQIALAIQQANLYQQLQQELVERQKTQEQLRERNRQLALTNGELAHATRLKDEFLANMSHELRTPLNAILGMTEGLQDQVFGPVNSPQLKALKTIERAGFHLLSLINDILDLAKIESGQIILDIVPTHVRELCQSSLTFIKQQATKKRIQIHTSIPPDLPPVLVDERRIRQVLINLLSNAVKFTPEGGSITLKVSRRWMAPAQYHGVHWITTYAMPQTATPQTSNGTSGITCFRGDYLRIFIMDTGVGIEPKQVDRIFQPFIQVDSALNRQHEGTGLGLALVKRIVELHGGEVGIASQVDVGTCFTIGLPVVPIVSQSPQFPTSLQQKSNGGNAIAPEFSPLILLAEDNEANITTLSSYLRAKGYTLTVAKTGQEAITLAQSQSPHLILMDIQMPGMDGLEAIQRIRHDPNLGQVPIVALTALAMPEDRERCLAVGATEYLSKPFKLRQLSATIQQLLAPQEEQSHVQPSCFDRG
jgi:PAS domain S-box-containing protein